MKKSAPFLILLAGILWGSMGIFVRTLNGYGIEAINIVAIRAWVTTICTLLFLLVTNRSLLKIRLRDIWCFIGTGCCSIVFFNYCYFYTIKITSMSIAAVLLYSAPAFVILLSAPLFHEKITLYKGISVIMVVIGCALVTGIWGNAQALTGMGLLTGIGAGFGYALYSIFGRFALDRGYHSFTILFYTFLCASIAVLPLADFSRITQVAFSSSGMFLFILIFGLLSTVIPYVTYTIGLQHVENGKASIIASIEPVMATTLGVLLYHETLSVPNLIGIVIVLAAIAFSELQPKSIKK